MIFLTSYDKLKSVVGSNSLNEAELNELSAIEHIVVVQIQKSVKQIYCTVIFTHNHTRMIKIYTQSIHFTNC